MITSPMKYIYLFICKFYLTPTTINKIINNQSKRQKAPYLSDISCLLRKSTSQLMDHIIVSLF